MRNKATEQQMIDYDQARGKHYHDFFLCVLEYKFVRISIMCTSAISDLNVIVFVIWHIMETVHHLLHVLLNLVRCIIPDGPQGAH